MSQALLFLVIHLVGLATLMAIGPRERPALCCALAFPLGLVVTTLVALVILIVGIPYGPISVGVTAAAILALGLRAAQARGGLERRTVLVMLAWTAAFGVLAVLITSFNVTIMTHDSHTFVMLGGVIGDDGELRDDVFAQLDEWGVFQVIVHSMARFTQQDYLYSLPPVFGVSSVGLFVMTLWHGLGAAGAGRRGRAWAVGLVTGAMVSIHMVAFHMVYLHTNWASAVYLLGFVTLFWLAEVEAQPTYIPAAFVCLTALALQRTETPIVALVFLSLTIGQSSLPRAMLTRWLAGFVVIVGLWYELLAHHVADSGEFLTPGRCRIVWAMLAAIFGWWCLGGRAWARRVNRALPVVVPAAAGLALVAAFVVRNEHMVTAATRWGRTLLHLPSWGGAWYALPALALLALAAPPPRFRQAFVVGVPVFFAMVLLLALGRTPYREGIDDSANRMTIHIVPLVFWYFGLKMLPGLLGAGARSPAPSSADIAP